MAGGYVEPRTDVPAAQDWSTGAGVAERRLAGRMLTVVAVALPLTVVFALVLPATPGNIAAETVLGLIGLFGTIGSSIVLVDRQRHRTRLLGQEWRRCDAVVLGEYQPVMRPRLLVHAHDETFVLRGFLSDQELEVVLDRGEVLLLGPDADGRGLLRVAGLCRIFAVRRIPGGGEAVAGVAREPGDPPAERELRTLRLFARIWVFQVAVGAVGAVVLLLGIWPVLSMLALVVGGALLVCGALSFPTTVRIGRSFAAAAAAAAAATTWTPLPITLLPRRRACEVAGLVRVGDRTVKIQFPEPCLEVMANIADTGIVWIRGVPTGAVAVGVPRLPLMTIGVLQGDRDAPPLKGSLRYLWPYEAGLSRIPALRR